MSKQPVLILGAASDIGLATAHAFAAQGHPVQLALREPARAEKDRADIALRHGVEASVHAFDILETDRHEAFLDGLPVMPGVAVCVVGLLGDQESNRLDSEKTALVLRTNFEGPAMILERLAERFEARGSGALVGVSSVAGERGRASNYVYGSAKAGFSAYLSGLRHRLAGTGVRVVTVKPGFVRTAMTEGMDLPERLTAAPEEVAERIFSSVQGGSEVIYVRRVWQPVMGVVRALPEMVFKKTQL